MAGLHVRPDLAGLGFAAETPREAGGVGWAVPREPWASVREAGGTAWAGQGSTWAGLGQARRGVAGWAGAIEVVGQLPAQRVDPRRGEPVLLYGTGMRVMECLRLRVQDVDFERREITVRDGKGQKDRRTMLPDVVVEDLRTHLQGVRKLHQQDLGNGLGRVYLPYALDRKYPNAAAEWRWQYVFPSAKLSVDPRSQETRRHHLNPSGLQKAVKAAVSRAGVLKQATCHTFRHYAESPVMPSWLRCGRGSRHESGRSGLWYSA